MFQKFNLIERLTVLTNVLTGHLGRISRLRGTLGLFSHEEKKAAIQALSRVGIADRAGQRASTLSGGQQRVGVFDGFLAAFDRYIHCRFTVR